MTRPTDWWVLDLEGDPTPGSPSRVRAMARRWREVADDAEWARRRVSQLMGDAAVGRWVGEAGDAFRDRARELPAQLGRCADSYGQAADALSWWADRLGTHQQDADAGLARGRVARHELERAEAAARVAAEQVSASMLVPAFAGPASVPSTDQVRDARARLAAAEAARSQADAAVADARSRLEAARRLVLDAQSLREADGRTAAARLHDAADAGIPERSRLEKLEDWAAAAWHVVVQVAKVVVAVLGVVALLIGGPLAWVVLAAALVLLAEAVARWVRGESPLWEVALAALGCIPGTRGLLDMQEVVALRGLASRALPALSGRSIRLSTSNIRDGVGAVGRRVRRLGALRDERGAIGAGRPRPPRDFISPTNPPMPPPRDVPAGFEVRVMPPTDQYPRGYWRIRNGRQYLDPSTMKQPVADGRMSKALFNAMTHVELPE